jgi:hypothetical protein
MHFPSMGFKNFGNNMYIYIDVESKAEEINFTGLSEGAILKCQWLISFGVITLVLL